MKHGNKFKDRSGEIHNGIEILSFVRKTALSQSVFLCRCHCGELYETVGSKVALGESRSCGCKKGMHKHGASKRGKREAEYKILSSMLNRCNNPNNKDFRYYGGKGVKVGPSWDSLEKYPQFLADMGRRPTPQHTIDRWPNCSGNYEPGNCRWATRKEQSDNRSVTVWLDFNGVKLPLNQMAKRHGIKASNLSSRLIKGWSLERALTTPVKTCE